MAKIEMTLQKSPRPKSVLVFGSGNIIKNNFSYCQCLDFGQDLADKLLSQRLSIVHFGEGHFRRASLRKDRMF